MQTSGASTAPGQGQGVDAAGQPVSAQPGTSGNTANAGASAQASSGVNDQDFLKKAAEANLAEIQIGQLAQQKASSDQVKQLAQQLVNDHQDNMKKLQDVAQKKSVTLPDKPDAKHQTKLDKMQNLSGAEFDKAFTKEQQKNHKKNLSMFSKAASSAQDPDVKSYASETAQALQQHLDMANKAADSVKSSGDATSSNSGSQGQGSATSASSQQPPQ